MSVSCRSSKILSSTAVALACVALIAVGASVVTPTGASPGALQPPTISPSGPIISLEGLRAGDERSADFTVGNPNLVATDLYVSGLITGGDSELYDVLTARISAAHGGRELWTGRLRDLDSGQLTNTISSDGTGSYTLTVGVPEWAGNDYQALRSLFDMRFTLVANGNGNGGDGGNGGGNADTDPPISSIGLASSKRLKKALKRAGRRKTALTFAGTARDQRSGVARVEVSLVGYPNSKVTRKRTKKCRPYVPRRKRFVRTKAKRCSPVWITARGTTTWKYKFPRQRLKPGRYELRVRAIDASGNVEQTFRTTGANRNLLRFHLH